MTDVEIICDWMESSHEEGDWWQEKNYANFGHSHTIATADLTLDKLRLVETKLDYNKRCQYVDLLLGGHLPRMRDRQYIDYADIWDAVNASSEVKIIALAKVIGMVNGK